jgi:hypothetical protein
MSTQKNQSFRPEAPKRSDTRTSRDPRTGDITEEYDGEDQPTVRFPSINPTLLGLCQTLSNSVKLHQTSSRYSY